MQAAKTHSLLLKRTFDLLDFGFDTLGDCLSQERVYLAPQANGARPQIDS
ncbi:MAG: hypothetical protein R2911_10235 [Caldilineaceae bacterium]